MSMFYYSTLALVIAVATGSSAAAETGKLDVYPQNEASTTTSVVEPSEAVVPPGVRTETQSPATVRTVGERGFQPTPNNPNQPRPQTPYGEADNANRSAATQAERYEVRRATNDRAQQQQQQQQSGPTVCEALIKKLIKANEAEIALAEMAQDKSDHKQIDQLTKALIKDHKALNETLKKMNDSNQSASTDQKKQKEQSKKSNKDVAVVPAMLCEIGDEACDNALEMTKEMLREKEGRDFDMAFLGQQCVCHTMTLAELKAIQSNGPKELQSFAEKAINKTEQHLDRIKDLMDDLQQDEENSKS